MKRYISFKNIFVCLLLINNCKGNDWNFLFNQPEGQHVQEHVQQQPPPQTGSWDAFFTTHTQQGQITQAQSNAFDSLFAAPGPQFQSIAKVIHTKAEPRAFSVLTPIPFSFPNDLSEQKIRKFKSFLPPNQTVVFFDTETTGLSGDYDRVIEVAFIERNYETMCERRLYSLFDPDGKRSGEKAFEAHKIPDSDLVGEMRFADFAPTMLDFVGNNLLIAHNLAFDYRMMNAEYKRASLDFIPQAQCGCTLKMSRAIFPGEKNSLDAVCERLNIDLSIRSHCHGSMQDSLLLADAFVYLTLMQHQMERDI